MLEKPNIPDERIIACLQDSYGIFTNQITFLALGADPNTAVYRVTSTDGQSYFCKLRSGDFSETSITVPKFLAAQGIPHVLASVQTKAGELRAKLDALKVILYPFIQGNNGYDIGLSDEQWIELGRALKKIHTTPITTSLAAQIQKETYSLQWCEIVKTHLARNDDTFFDDLLALKLAAFLKSKRGEILDLVARTEQLALTLRAQPPAFVLCHADIHAWNLMVESGGAFYIIDWDTVILAPKERDLMFIGAGLFGEWHTPQEEENLFYQGYGQTEIDFNSLTYYRFARIVEDNAVECEQIVNPNVPYRDREREFEFLKSNFLPNGTIELAYKSDISNL